MQPGCASGRAGQAARVAPGYGEIIEMIEGTRNDDRIRARANKIWKTEGRPDGKALEHWLQAERKLAVEPAKESGAGADGASNVFAGAQIL